MLSWEEKETFYEERPAGVTTNRVCGCAMGSHPGMSVRLIFVGLEGFARRAGTLALRGGRSMLLVGRASPHDSLPWAALADEGFFWWERARAGIKAALWAVWARVSVGKENGHGESAKVAG